MPLAVRGIAQDFFRVVGTRISAAGLQVQITFLEEATFTMSFNSDSLLSGALRTNGKERVLSWGKARIIASTFDFASGMTVYRSLPLFRRDVEIWRAKSQPVKYSC